MVSRDENYIDSLNLRMKNSSDIEGLLIEFEQGRLSREEYISLTLLSHSMTSSLGYERGYKSGKKNKK